MRTWRRRWIPPHLLNSLKNQSKMSKLSLLTASSPPFLQRCYSALSFTSGSEFAGLWNCFEKSGEPWGLCPVSSFIPFALTSFSSASFQFGSWSFCAWPPQVGIFFKHISESRIGLKVGCTLPLVRLSSRSARPFGIWRESNVRWRAEEFVLDGDAGIYWRVLGQALMVGLRYRVDLVLRIYTRMSENGYCHVRLHLVFCKVRLIMNPRISFRCRIHWRSKMLINSVLLCHSVLRDRGSLRWVILQSVINLTRFHLGSMAVGTLLITLLRIPRLALAFVQRVLRRWEGLKLVQLLAQCCSCCLNCYENWLSMIHHNAYTVIAIQGVNFCPAARLVRLNKRQVLASASLRLISNQPFFFNLSIGKSSFGGERTAALRD